MRLPSMHTPACSSARREERKAPAEKGGVLQAIRLCAWMATALANADLPPVACVGRPVWTEVHFANVTWAGERGSSGWPEEE
mmetsp:Transcript_40404/g.91588  ORF Transcript_40404/g.91588 Transcript_40404/m.91588 type:complete len:82 (+) Transcript_40404:464-709(+)